MIDRTPTRSRNTTDNRPPTYCLSIHAGYRCRHSGACCTAGWDIPVEAPVAAAVQARFDAPGHALFFRTSAGPHDPPVLATGKDGACIFFDAAHGRLCRVHSSLGESMLPSACRQFPRVTLTDARGTWITLSHFCPTAARLLFTPTPVHHAVLRSNIGRRLPLHDAPEEIVREAIRDTDLLMAHLSDSRALARLIAGMPQKGR